MGKVLAGMTMSLDGFIQDSNGSVARLYPDLDALRQTDLLQEEIRRTGAVVMGRRAYDMAQGDFTGYEFQVPIFVLTDAAPATVARGENDRLRFTFVTDGIEHAIAQARAAAGDKDVAVIGGAQTVQQCLQAGLVDELQIDLSAAEQLGVDPRRCVVVEDAPAGVSAGRAAGMIVLALVSTHAARQLRQANALIEQLAHLYVVALPAQAEARLRVHLKAHV